MMFNFARTAAFAGVIATVAAPAWAADLFESQPRVEEAPVEVAYQPVEVGGWYIRGDISYADPDFRGGDWVTPGPGSNSFTSGSLRGTWAAGLGVGYQINSHLRTDLTFDYIGKTRFRGSSSGACGVAPDCISTDVSNFSAWGLLANAYIDLGTWHGFTPYVGAGIGGAHVKWDTLFNTACDATDPTSCDPTESHGGKSKWRFSYALMAGASYCLTDRWKLDAGYRFRHISGGAMFGPSDIGVTGPGSDKGINIHEVRGGLRYQFGNSDCAQPVVAYEPPPEPIYTK